ncbi:MAG TPA: VOC family protein [Xanthomonadaceae bacterium]|nr:VOC family protein [Xanthomonadaceae bacterium]
MLNPNVPAWFEIPAVDLDRAQRFYEGLLATGLRREVMGYQAMAVFPVPDDKQLSTGALVAREGDTPRAEGTTVYLSVRSVDAVLERVESGGGRVLVPRTELPEGMGCYALFVDSEGNRVGLWSAD